MDEGLCQVFKEEGLRTSEDSDLSYQHGPSVVLELLGLYDRINFFPFSVTCIMFRTTKANNCRVD